MNYELPFTNMGSMVDGVAVNACIASGMIVIVETNDAGEISGIVSAHTNVRQAHAAYLPFENDYRCAIIVPQESGPMMLHCSYSFEELRDLANM